MDAKQSQLSSMHMQNLIKFHQFVHKILSGTEILMLTKDHNCVVVYLQKCMHFNPNLALAKVNVYAKFYLIPSMCSQDVEQKRKFWH